MYITLFLSQGLIAFVGYILHLLDFQYWSEEGNPTNTFWVMVLLHLIALSMWAEGYGIA